MEKHIILIADDVEINRKMLSFIFEEQYQLLEAADGVETIDLDAQSQSTQSRKCRCQNDKNRAGC